MIRPPEAWADQPLSFWDTRPTVGCELWNYIKKLQEQELRPDAEVLEVGCGKGTFSQLFPHYTGIDVAAQAIQEAQRLYPEKRFINANFLDLTGLGPVDMVMAHAVLEHHPHFDAGLRWCLKQSQRLVVISICTGCPAETRFFYNTGPVWTMGVYENAYSLRDFQWAAEYYGWRIRETTTCGNGHDPAFVLVFERP